MTIFAYLIGVLITRAPFNWLTILNDVLFLFFQWLPFLGKPEDNPHAKYYSTYTQLPNNTKSAVQLAYEHLTSLANSTGSTKIHILTFDGTMSLGAYATTGNKDATGNLVGKDAMVESGGAYPAALAYRLKYGLSSTSSTPTLSTKWTWHGVDYHPEYSFGEPAVFGTQVPTSTINVFSALTATIPTLGKNVTRAVTMAQQIINTIPVGEKIVLSGLSQGTFPIRVLYDEFRIGALQSRRADLIGIVNFGDCARPAGWTIPGGTDPGGEGVCKLPVWLPLSQQWTSSGLIQNPDSFYWSFCNPNDAAAASALGSSFGGKIMGLLVKAVLYGPPPTTSFGWGLLEDWTSRTDYMRMVEIPFSSPLTTLESTPAKVAARRRNRSAVDRAALQSSATLAAADPAIFAVSPSAPPTIPVGSGLVSANGTEKDALTTVRRWNDGVNRHSLFTACGTSQDGWGFYNDPGNPAGRTALLAMVNSVLTEGGLPTLTSLPGDGANGADLGIASPDAIVVYRANQNFYNWVPVSYPAAFPGAAVNIDNAWQPGNISFADSVTIGTQSMISLIQNTPGTFALCGMSQGAMVISNVLKAMQPGGVLASRYNDCIAGVAFGNPMRRQGGGLPGVASTTGAGMFSVPNPVGALSGLSNVAVPDWWWEMNCPGDFFSDAPMSAASGAAGAILNKIVSLFVVIKGTANSSFPLDFATQIINALATGVGVLVNSARSQTDVAGLRALGLWLRDQGLMAALVGRPVAIGIVAGIFKLTNAEVTTNLLVGNYPRGNPHIFYGIKKPASRPTGLATWTSNYTYVDVAVSYLNQRAGAVTPRASRVRRDT